MAVITKKELATYLAGVNGTNRTLAEKIISDLFDRIVAEVAEGNAVNIHGFGKFEQKTRAARTGRNPATGETIEIAEKQVIAFKAAKQTREEVAK